MNKQYKKEVDVAVATCTRLEVSSCGGSCKQAIRIKLAWR